TGGGRRPGLGGGERPLLSRDLWRLPDRRPPRASPGGSMTMASLPMFKTAVLGTGGIARAHAEALIAIGMPPLACADVVPGRAAVFAQRYHIPSAYDSVQ